MPSASALDLVAHLTASDPDFLQALPELLTQFDAGFAQEAYDERHALLTQFSKTQRELFRALQFHAYDCYYQNDRVLTGIGSSAGPPFPRGNTLESGDLSLLDAVMQGGHRYRS